MEKNLLSRIQKNAKNWWISLLIGIISLLLGIWCLFTPLETFAALSIVFTISFFAGGLMEIIFALSNTQTMKNWGWTLAMGIIDLIFGFILISNPIMAPVLLACLIAFWLLFQAIWGIGISIDLKSVEGSEWGWLLALSIIGVFAAFLLIFRPEITALFTAYIVSFGFIFYGIFRIYLSLKLKSIEKHLE